MSTRTLPLSDELHAYLCDVGLREPEILRRLRERTARMPNAEFQISPEQGQFMRLLTELIGARRAVEVGTFTGYSALCIALALPPDGRLLCCDVNREWTDMARTTWREAGVDERIELVIAPARETLRQRLDAGAGGTIDLMFIDADKAAYDEYYELGLELLRPGGAVLLDNAFRAGRVVCPAPDDRDSAAIDALNRKVQADPRVSSCLLPIGDGLLMVRKR